MPAICIIQSAFALLDKAISSEGTLFQQLVEIWMPNEGNYT